MSMLWTPKFESLVQSGHDKLEVLREQWESCSGDWKNSQIYLSLRKTNAERKRGRRAWLTRADLVRKYQSEEIADRIIQNKLSNEELKKTQTKPHPDDPTNEASNLKLCFICKYGVY